MTDAAVRSDASASRAEVSTLDALGWGVRRELWENRYLYLAPFATAVFFVVAFFVSLVTLPERTRAALALPSPARHDALLEPYMFAALLLLAAGTVVGIFYCLEALYAERRDRSILFWRSLPVSDTTTVVAKAIVPLIVLPLLSAIAVIAVHLVMLLLTTISLSVQGQSPATLWQEVAPAQGALTVLYHVVTVHILWYAPAFGWLLLASASARRAPFLWAGIPILAVVIIEQIAFDSARFLAMLQYRLAGGPERLAGSSAMPIDPLTHVTPGTFFSSPGLWGGLALTAVFLAATIRIRRRQRAI